MVYNTLINIIKYYIIIINILLLFCFFKDKIMMNAGSMQKKYILSITINKKYQTIFLLYRIKVNIFLLPMIYLN